MLDLNLPRRTGLEVLADLKAGRDLLPIPVLILITSAALPDVQLSYSLHASVYVSKAADFDGFTEAIRADRRLVPGAHRASAPVVTTCRTFSPADYVSGPWRRVGRRPPGEAVRRAAALQA